MVPTEAGQAVVGTAAFQGQLYVQTVLKQNNAPEAYRGRRNIYPQGEKVSYLKENDLLFGKQKNDQTGELVTVVA